MEVFTEAEDAAGGCCRCGSMRLGHLCTHDVEGRAKLQARNALTLSCVRATKKSKGSEASVAADSVYQCHRCLKRQTRSSFSSSQIKRGRNACCSECVKNFPTGGYLGTSDEQLRRQDIDILSMGRTHDLMDPALVQDVVEKGKKIHSLLERHPNAAKVLLDRAASLSVTVASKPIPCEKDAPWWLPEEYTAESLGFYEYEVCGSDDDGSDDEFDDADAEAVDARSG